MARASEETVYGVLSRTLGARATREPARLEAFAWDFGGLVRRAPAIVVEPASADEVLFTLRVARDHGFPISTRGSGHSQSGQCLSEGAIAIEMRRLGAVQVDVAQRVVVAEGGATWSRVVDEASAFSLLPRGLTLVLDTTVAGTLSVGGVGAQSFQFGAQVNNVTSLDVATLDGQVLRCSAEEHRDLFDAVRSGLGQFGVILRASYPLRPCKTRVRTYFFVYEDAATCLADSAELQARPRGELLLGFVTRGEARHVLLLALGKEFDREEELDDHALRAGLRFKSELRSSDAPLWNESGIPGHVFFRVHTGKPWNEQGGAPAFASPWVDHLFVPEVAAGVLAKILAEPPAPLRMGTCGIIPVAATGTPAPLFTLPPHAEGDLLIGLGMFPKVPRGLRKDAIAEMSDYSRTYCAVGGKRYLSGFVDFDSGPQWADHYGAAWPWLTEMKRRHDPHGLLNAGFLRFD